MTGYVDCLILFLLLSYVEELPFGLYYLPDAYVGNENSRTATCSLLEGYDKQRKLSKVRNRRICVWLNVSIRVIQCDCGTDACQQITTDVRKSPTGQGHHVTQKSEQHRELMTYFTAPVFMDINIH